MNQGVLNDDGEKEGVMRIKCIRCVMKKTSNSVCTMCMAVINERSRSLMSVLLMNLCHCENGGH